MAPRAKILLLGILPRGPNPDDAQRPTIARLNRLLSRCADGQRVIYMDPGPGLLDRQGRLPTDISPGGLHLTGQGYAKLAEALAPQVTRLLATP